MRKALLVVLIVAVGVGCAHDTITLGPQSSWTEIRSTLNVHAEIPMVFFGTRGVGVIDICVVGDKLRGVSGDGVMSEIPVANHPLSYEIRVVEQVDHGEFTYTRYLFTKHHVIPACSQRQ